MKLVEIVNAHNTIDSFAEKENIGAHLAYVMTKFVVATQPDFDFYAKEMNKLFDKYGERDKENKVYVKEENVEAFQKAVQELQDTEATDPGIRFSLKEISQELKVSMKQIYQIMPFINDGEE